MNNKKIRIIIWVLFFSITQHYTFAETTGEAYLNVTRTFLQKKQYALHYDAYLITGEGAETSLSDKNSVVVRNNLTLYTTNGKIEYIINTEGSIIINTQRKRITINLQPLSPQETIDFSSSLDTQITNQLATAIDKCDSITLTNLNGYKIYTSYEKDSPFSKAECWVNGGNEIKEIRYYLKDDQYLYQRLVYNYIDINTYLPKLDFSYYITLQGDKYVASTNYSGYEIIIGHQMEY